MENSHTHISPFLLPFNMVVFLGLSFYLCICILFEVQIYSKETKIMLDRDENFIYFYICMFLHFKIMLIISNCVK